MAVGKRRLERCDGLVPLVHEIAQGPEQIRSNTLAAPNCYSRRTNRRGTRRNRRNPPFPRGENLRRWRRRFRRPPRRTSGGSRTGASDARVWRSNSPSSEQARRACPPRCGRAERHARRPIPLEWLSWGRRAAPQSCAKLIKPRGACHMPGLPWVFMTRTRRSCRIHSDQPNGAEPKRTWRRSQIHAKSSQ